MAAKPDPAEAAPADRPALTARDEAVAALLRQAVRPLGAYDLVDLLRDRGVTAPTTVYRSLNRLIAAGLAHRLESLNAFVPCRQSCSHGFAVFAICETCGSVTEFEDKIVADRLAAWAGAAGFGVGRMSLEMRGQCGRCARAAPPERP